MGEQVDLDYGIMDKGGQRAVKGLCSNTLSCVLHLACVLLAASCVVLLASCLLVRVSLHDKCEERGPFVLQASACVWAAAES